MSTLSGKDHNAQKVEEMARELGVLPKNGYAPGLDARWFGESSASLSLHDGDVPIRMSGLGSRRLLAAAIQKSVLKAHGAVLVDEIEHGLEPHRIVHLVRTLTAGEENEAPQLFVTTHSPTAIAEIGASGISVVQCTDGVTSVVAVPNDNDFAGLVRAQPEALLGKKVIVCEGPTEGGLCWALDQIMQETQGSFGLMGVVVSNGVGNSQGPRRAVSLAQLGYEVAFFGDSDESPNPNAAEMEAAGVRVFLWPGSMCTEERIVTDLSVEGLQAVIDLARSRLEDESLQAQITSRLGGIAFSLSVQQWIDEEKNLEDLRKAIGMAAKKNSWFKTWTWGQELGQCVLPSILADEDSPAKGTIKDLIDWIGVSEPEEESHV